MGLASEQESSEFEQLCSQYPELLAARNEFERELEKKVLEQSISPPQDLKERILHNIGQQESVAKESKVVSMHSRPHSSNWLRYVAAASIILLLASSYFVFDLYSKNRKLENSISSFKVQIDSLTDQLAFDHKMMADPDVAVVSMMNPEKSPSSAKVYWDTTSSDVYMVIKNMPSLPTEKQFQLWAFIDNKPVDLGLFDLPPGNVILKMRNTQKAEAFAITIEKRGNGPVPHGTVETYGKMNL